MGGYQANYRLYYNSPQNNTPGYNITSDEEEIIISFTRPGLKKEDFSVQLVGDKLEVSLPDERVKSINVLSIDKDVDFKSISAEYRAGILEIKLGKREIEKRDITIK